MRTTLKEPATFRRQAYRQPITYDWHLLTYCWKTQSTPPLVPYHLTVLIWKSTRRQCSWKIWEKPSMPPSLACFIQGLDLSARVNAREGWGVNLQHVARIWRAGCIIKSDYIMDLFERHYVQNPGRHPSLWRGNSYWGQAVLAFAKAGCPQGCRSRRACSLSECHLGVSEIFWVDRSSNEFHGSLTGLLRRAWVRPQAGADWNSFKR